jgi:hypothetical protein
MNQNIQNWIIEQASNVTNWANAEVPLVIQEFLIWNFYSGLINIVGILISLVIIFGLCIKFKKTLLESFKCGEDPLLMIITLIFTIPIVISLLVFLFCDVKDVIQIKVAPKVYLVEKAAEMIKK